MTKKSFWSGKKFVFHPSAGKHYDDDLAVAFRTGCKELGLRCEIIPTGSFDSVDDSAYVGCAVGVKKRSLRIMDRYRKAQKHFLYFDKGYLGGGATGSRGNFLRMSLDDFQPLAYVHRFSHREDRWLKYGQEIQPCLRDRPGEYILFAGSSQKYCNYHSLGDATAYASRIFKRARLYTARPFIYRPKPSWAHAVPIENTLFSGPSEGFKDVLKRTNCVITHGSNACLEAVLNGVPAIVLGEGITRGLCSTDLSDIPNPKLPHPKEVYRLACGVAYCQWTLEEYASGEALKSLIPLLEEAP